MAQRAPLTLDTDGIPRRMAFGDKCAGHWAKVLPVAVGGAVSTVIPAGFFNALPVIGHTIQATGTRDYEFRLSGLTLNADKSVTISGVIRESRTLPASVLTLLALQGYDTFQATTSAVILHLSAQESD